MLVALALVAACRLAAAPSPGQAVDITGQSGEWDGGHRMFPFALQDTSIDGYKLYYSAGSRYEISDSAWGQWMIGLATSKDGVSWGYDQSTHLPVVPAMRWLQGDVLNPDDLAKVFDSVYAIGACAIRDGPVYKMWYTGWAGEVDHVIGGIENKINYRIGYATSKDGVTWEKYPGKAGSGAVFVPDPANPHDCKGVGQPFVVKDGGVYRMWYEGFDGKSWRILSATSQDGIAWTRTGTVIDMGGKDALDRRGARNPVIIDRAGSRELWYQGRSSSDPKHHVLRAVFKNGAWEKMPGEVVLHPPTPVTGNEAIYVDSALVLPDGSLQVYFARENLTTSQVTEGIVENRRYSIYTEVVNP